MSRACRRCGIGLSSWKAKTGCWRMISHSRSLSGPGFRRMRSGGGVEDPLPLVIGLQPRAVEELEDAFDLTFGDERGGHVRDEPLLQQKRRAVEFTERRREIGHDDRAPLCRGLARVAPPELQPRVLRSEERRGGKEGRSRWS